MRNTFLSNLRFTDRVYPAVTRMPAQIRSRVAAWVPKHLEKKLDARGMPDRLTIFVTDECNLRCPHCFIITDHQEKAEWTAGIEEYRKLFRSISGSVSQVLLTGGEPTLRKDLGDIIVAAAQEGGISQVGIFTHGLQKERTIAAARFGLENSRVTLNFQVSIDGTEEFHDVNRGVKGGLRRTLATMKAIRDLDAEYPGRVGRMAACTAISRRNIGQIPEIADTVRALGFLHAFTFVRRAEVWGLRAPEELSTFSPSHGYDDYLTPHEMRQAIGALRKHLWDRFPGNLYYATNRVTLETIAYMHEHKKEKAPCRSGKAELTILADGAVARCENLRPGTNLVDFDWDLRRLIESEAFERNYEKTHGCYCTQDCALNVSTMYSKVMLEELFTRKKASGKS